ncbi:MAG: hypothetical protein EOO77_43840, partial [Oxalobacteraceae bacterium]
MEAMQNASDTYDQASEATDLAILDLAREQAKTIGQWLVLAYDHDELLDRDGETLLSPSHSEALKWGALRALKNAVGVAQGHLAALRERLPPESIDLPELVWCDFELRATLAHALLIMREVSSETLGGLPISELVEDFISHTTGTPEFESIADDNKAWIWGLQATLLTQDGRHQEAKAALDRAEQFSGDDPE